MDSRIFMPAEIFSPRSPADVLLNRSNQFRRVDRMAACNSSRRLFKPASGMLRVVGLCHSFAAFSPEYQFPQNW